MRKMVSPSIAAVALVIVAVAPGRSHAADLATLVGFCAAGFPNCADGSGPAAGLIADANGNLFGTTIGGGTGNQGGTVFEIAKTADGYASTPTILVSFCALPRCADGARPNSLIAHSDDVGRAFRLMSATCSDRSRPAVPMMSAGMAERPLVGGDLCITGCIGSSGDGFRNLLLA